MALEGEGFDVLSVISAEEAIAGLRDGARRCIVVLDWRMPGMDGAAFRRAQLADPMLHRVPVIVATGESEIAQEAYDLGIREILRKPVDTKLLVRAIEKYCEHAQDSA